MTGGTAVPRLGPKLYGEHVRLPDGSQVVIRPVRSSDGPLLLEGFSRLSPNSRRMRFLIGKSALTANEVRYFTDIDHHSHEALAALDARTGRGIGVARYIRGGGEARSADVAVTVVDEWQRRGVGSALMCRLALRARENGITHFSALIAADNAAVLALLRRMHADVDLVGYDVDTTEYEISLRAPHPGGCLAS